MKFRVVLVQSSERQILGERIRDLESLATYPFGDDSFRIDHGDDYFQFFDRLGKVSYYCVLDGERLAAVGAGILRDVPLGIPTQMKKAWYLFDLKVHPDYRGMHLPLLIFRKAAIPSLFQAWRGYAVSMNNEGSNKVAAIFSRARLAALSIHSVLNIYSLSHEEVRSHRSLLEKHRGPLSFLVLNGIKDLIMSKTALPMPLAHIQFGPMGGQGIADSIEGFRHMIAAPAEDPLAQDLAKAGVKVDATATILHYRMAAFDFKFLLTSDI